MAQIYISSTYVDLKEHRERVYHALRQLGHGVTAMEDYVAADQRPLNRCLADVAASDVYIGIFAFRYGFIPQDGNPEGRSITELEYRHAQSKGKTRLVFLVDPAAPWPATWMDMYTGDGERGRRIEALREELGHNLSVRFFTNADQLAQQVNTAVTLVEDRSTATEGRRWTIPPPVRSFAGRDMQLAAMRTRLTTVGNATLTPAAALTGMGGVGKTQLALAYAQLHRDDYELGWWVPSETRLGLLTALGELGVELGLPPELPPVELATRARDSLGTRSGWLLVFDNAPDPAAVADFLPGGAGHVLVTSRNSGWRGIADPIPVDLLEPEDAVDLLLDRTGDSDRQAATALAEELGRLPLALEQAAAYAAGLQMSLAAYLELFAQRRSELLTLGQPMAYGGTVDAAFSLALDQLQEANPAAVQLVELCALFAPDEIPLSLLLSQPPLLPDPLAAAMADPLRYVEVKGALYQTGLLTRVIGENARMHRLVRDVTLAHLSEADLYQRTVDGIELLGQLFPFEGGEPQRWPHCAQLLPHAQSLLAHAQLKAPHLHSPSLARLLTGIGNDLHELGDYEGARELHEQALAMRQRLYDGDHPEVAHSLRSLANDLHRLEDYEGARELDEQALAMRQRLYDGDHPEVARSLSNLAADLFALKEHERARELDERALAMRQRLYDGDNRDVATSLSNLALEIHALGEQQRARELNEQALAMRQRLYEGDHREVATSLNNLAVDFRDAGVYERARELNEQALAMRQRLYHGDHPEMVRSLTNLAFCFRQLGEPAQARELDERALAMDVRLYHGDHREVATSLYNLADDLHELGDHERARELNEQALAMRQRLYHGDHPDIARSLNNLANDLHELGEYARAVELDDQALAMRQRLAKH